MSERYISPDIERFAVGDRVRVFWMGEQAVATVVAIEVPHNYRSIRRFYRLDIPGVDAQPFYEAYEMETA